jgi:hypothetical protein
VHDHRAADVVYQRLSWRADRDVMQDDATARVHQAHPPIPCGHHHLPAGRVHGHGGGVQAHGDGVQQGSSARIEHAHAVASHICHNYPTATAIDGHGAGVLSYCDRAQQPAGPRVEHVDRAGCIVPGAKAAAGVDHEGVMRWLIHHHGQGIQALRDDGAQQEAAARVEHADAPDAAVGNEGVGRALVYGDRPRAVRHSHGPQQVPSARVEHAHTPQAGIGQVGHQDTIRPGFHGHGAGVLTDLDGAQQRPAAGIEHADTAIVAIGHKNAIGALIDGHRVWTSPHRHRVDQDSATGRSQREHQPDRQGQHHGQC